MVLQFWLPVTLLYGVITCQSDVIFLRKMEIGIYTFIRSGIMENWIKHELYHLNNEVLWWHDVTHDNMSSYDICDMTSMHDLISIKLNIWLLLYVAVSELERWFYFCFAWWRWNYRVNRYIPTIAVCVTFTRAFRRDLETEGHVMVYVTFVISACICPTAMIFLLFRRVVRSRNSFQLSLFA